MISAGLNGFGRFGLRLFRQWLTEKNTGKTNFDIVQINEPFLSPSQIVHMTRYDDISGPFEIPLKLIGKSTIKTGAAKIEVLSQPDVGSIRWDPKIELVFECTGKFVEKKMAKKHIKNNIKKVLISATSLSADKTIIIGFNEKEYDPQKHCIVSYGSCTTNCFLPIAKLIYQKFGILSAQASVVHSTPLNQIKKPFGEIRLKPCTLETAGPRLLPALKNFYVNYRLVPYPCVSLMDLEFKTKKKATARRVNQLLENSSNKELKGIIKIEHQLKDSNNYRGSPFSAIIIASQTRVVGNSLLLTAWFDNENSATRFNEVAKMMARQL